MNDWNTYCAAVYAARITDPDTHRANRMVYLECLDRIHEAMCEHVCSLCANNNACSARPANVAWEANEICESMAYLHRVYERELKSLR